MKAYIVNKYKTKDAGQMMVVPMPELKRKQVIVQIFASSINPLDLKIMHGDLKLILPYRRPFILGHDLSGVVTKVGDEITQFKLGDEVYCRAGDYQIGTFAEFLAVNEEDLAIKPKTLTMLEAASVPLIGLTAWQALVEKGSVKKGQKVFIQAGSGGVGTFAIQLAKHLGAIVATTTSTANIEFVKTLGADIVVDYKRDDFTQILSGYDIVLHSQDRETLEKSLRVLKPGGILISLNSPPDLGFAKQIKAPWYMSLIMRSMSFGINRKARKLGVTYSFLFMRASGEQLAHLSSLIDSGIIKPVVDKVFKFSEISDAIAYVESGRTKGKVVLSIK